MNILFGILSYDGGAPYSVLQYCKLLKARNYNVCMIGEPANKKVMENCRDSGIEVLECEYLNRALIRHNIFKTLKIFNNLYKSVAEFKPDLIIAAGHRHFYYTIAKLLGVPCLFMVCGGNLSEHDFEAKLWKAEYTICFSEENKKDLMKFGYPENRISVISNRIDAGINEEYLDLYDKKCENAEILFVSRLVSTKLNSAIYTVGLIDWLNGIGIPVNLKIAGSGDGFEEIKKLSEDVNRKYGREIIKLLGFVPDVNSLIGNVHIMFGKGRSILEPMIKGKLGVVVGENDDMSLCTLSSFNNLYEHNFAGRSMSDTITKEEFSEIIRKIINGTYGKENVRKISLLTAEYYSAEGLDKKVLPVIEKYIDKNEKKVKKFYKLTLFKAAVNYELKKATAKIKRIFF